MKAESRYSFWVPLLITLCSHTLVSKPELSIATNAGHKNSSYNTPKITTHHTGTKEVQPTTPQPKKSVNVIVGGRRAKKKGPRIAKKTIRDMNYDELKDLKKRLLSQNKHDLAIKCLDKMVPLCKDANELKDIMLELADLLFNDGKLPKAEALYTEYAKLYPGSDKIESALYKALLCAFYSTLEADRDQTKTNDALALAEKFLEREAVFKTYTDEVKNIKKLCHVRLFESEENVINFYLNRGFEKDFIAAQQRINLARKDFSSHVPEIEPRLLSLEIRLAQREKKSEIATAKELELAQKFPDYESKTVLAQAERKGFAHRF